MSKIYILYARDVVPVSLLSRLEAASNDRSAGDQVIIGQLEKVVFASSMTGYDLRSACQMPPAVFRMKALLRTSDIVDDELTERLVNCIASPSDATAASCYLIDVETLRTFLRKWKGQRIGWLAYT